MLSRFTSWPLMFNLNGCYFLLQYQWLTNGVALTGPGYIYRIRRSIQNLLLLLPWYRDSRAGQRRTEQIPHHVLNQGPFLFSCFWLKPILSAHNSCVAGSHHRSFKRFVGSQCTAARDITPRPRRLIWARNLTGTCPVPPSFFHLEPG